MTLRWGVVWHSAVTWRQAVGFCREEKRKMEQEADFASQLRDLEDQLASLKT